jgi:dihydrofolate reductase
MYKLKMEAILSIDSNNGLSKEGIIPWKSTKDLNFFYETTKNNVVIMGKNTYLSLPDNSRPLKHRLNIVLTNHPDIFLNEPSYKNNEIIFTNNPNIHSTILNNRQKFREFYPFLSMNFKIFFIGGKQIYDLYIPFCDVVWVTRIKNAYACDLTFDFDLNKQFKETQYGEDDDIKISKYKKL